MSYLNFEINKNHHLYFDADYRSLPVMSGNYPMIEEYLQALYDVLMKAMNQYGRVFAFRVDLHMPCDQGSASDVFCNSTVSQFIASFKAKIRHNRTVVAKSGSFFHDTSIRYFWVREVGDCGRLHYHLVFFLNGYAFNWLGNYQSSETNMANRIWEAWASALGVTVESAKTLVHFPENPVYMVFRDKPESVAALFHRASYLCKARTKQYGSGHHGYSASRS